jgi:hypothetical protein
MTEIFQHRLDPWSRSAEKSELNSSAREKAMAWHAAAKVSGESPRILCDLGPMREGITPEMMVDLMEMVRATPRLAWFLVMDDPAAFGACLREARYLLMTRMHALSDRGCRLIEANPLYQPYMEDATNGTFDDLQARAKRQVGVLEMLCAWACAEIEDHPNEPPPGVWLAVRLSTQAQADARLSQLLNHSAFGHLVLCDPLREAINLQKGYLAPGGTMTSDVVDHLQEFQKWESERGRAGLWVVCAGGEGDGSQPVHPFWVAGLRDECARAGVPFFFRGWGRHLPWDARHMEGRPDVKIELHTRMMPDGTVPVAGSPMTREEMDCYQRDGFHMVRVDPEQSGRVLDGKTWSAVPAPAGSSR